MQATEWVRWVVAILTADGRIDFRERAFLRTVGTQWGLAPAALESCLTEALKNRKELPIPADAEDRDSLIKVLIEAAASDGVIAPEERWLLGRVASRIGMKPSALDASLEAALEFQRGKTSRRSAPAPLAAAPARALDAAPTPESPGERRAVGPDGVPVDWVVGDRIVGLYDVRAILDVSSLGRTYTVRHRAWGVDLAVRSPRAEWFAAAKDRDAFVREAETWVNLGLHPNVASCFYVRVLGGVPRLFVEYVDGGSLSSWIRGPDGPGRLYEGGESRALARVLDVAIQLAWALKHAHEQGLVHQDVKPSNILLTGGGTAKVTDFGLSGSREAFEPLSKSEPWESLGPILPTDPATRRALVTHYGGMTPAFYSPEQADVAAQARAGVPAEKRTRLTTKTDVWSWGVTVLAMFTGDITWVTGRSAHEALEAARLVDTGNPALRNIPDDVYLVLRRCLSVNLEGRPRSLGEVAASLLPVYRACVGSPYPRREPKAAGSLADLNNRAVAMLDLGRPFTARSLFEEARRRYPEALEPPINEALLLWESAASEKAAAEASPSAADAGREAGAGAGAAGEKRTPQPLDDALAGFGARHPRSYDAARYRALRAIQRGRLDEAQLRLAEADRAEPERPETCVARALAALAKGAGEEAVSAFRAAVERRPERASFGEYLAVALLCAGRHGEAAAAFRRAAEAGRDAALPAWAEAAEAMAARPASAGATTRTGNPRSAVLVCVDASWTTAAGEAREAAYPFRLEPEYRLAPTDRVETAQAAAAPRRPGSSALAAACVAGLLVVVWLSLRTGAGDADALSPRAWAGIAALGIASASAAGVWWLTKWGGSR
ncbi:MAG: protein kinase [Planctomycetes bacterium]|nr:protein kinase [Planctomycetota bacterium]